MLPIEQCYGFIVILKREHDMFLILERMERKGDWTFPKGHTEDGETPEETALRELKEETGIKEIEILDFPLIHEEYEIVKNGELRLKINDYFVGFVEKNIVNIEKEEIQSYKWVSFDDALDSFEHERRKQVLREAKKHLDNMLK